MAFFDFIKEAGEKLFGNAQPDTNEKIDKLKNHITTLGLPDAKNIDIQIDENGLASLNGEVVNQAARDKIIVAVGNVDGISGVTDNIVVHEPAEGCQYYTVTKGDTLSSISRRIYADANKYNIIFEANKPMLTSPDKIYPGQKLIIPAVQA